MATANDTDHRIIDAVSIALKGQIGLPDDVDRLLAEVLPENKERTLAEIAVAFIRYAQDLKAR